jgi:hypothetical protein
MQALTARQTLYSVFVYLDDKPPAVPVVGSVDAQPVVGGGDAAQSVAGGDTAQPVGGGVNALLVPSWGQGQDVRSIHLVASCTPEQLREECVRRWLYIAMWSNEHTKTHKGMHTGGYVHMNTQTYNLRALMWAASIPLVFLCWSLNDLMPGCVVGLCMGTAVPLGILWHPVCSYQRALLVQAYRMDGILVTIDNQVSNCTHYSSDHSIQHST